MSASIQSVTGSYFDNRNGVESSSGNLLRNAARLLIAPGFYTCGGDQSQA